MNKLNAILLLLLLIWFTWLTHSSVLGDTIFTINFFHTETSYDLVTTLWWAVFTLLVIVYFVKPKIGKYACAAFQLVWIIAQSMNFSMSPEVLVQYNRVFENTHHIIAPSDTIWIPDTAHLILFALLIMSFLTQLSLIIISKKKVRNG